MVVQSVALPKMSGGSREQELVVVPADGAAAVAGVVVPDTQGRVLRAVVIVPMIAVTELAWLGVLGYAFVRFFL